MVNIIKEEQPTKDDVKYDQTDCKQPVMFLLQCSAGEATLGVAAGVLHKCAAEAIDQWTVLPRRDHDGVAGDGV